MDDSPVEKAKQDMLDFADLSEQAIESIRRRLINIPVPAISEDSLKSEFESALPETPKRPLISERLSEVLWNIYRLSIVSDDDIPSVISGLGAWVGDEGGLPTEIWSAAQRNLLLLADIPSLYVAVKAVELRSAVDKELSSVKLITDLRPVFPRQTSDGPAGFLLIHTLQLSLADIQGGEELYFGVADSLLEDFAAQVERAIAKRQALLNSLPKELILLT